jgi:hypothetical protein
MSWQTIVFAFNYNNNGHVLFIQAPAECRLLFDARSLTIGQFKLRLNSILLIISCVFYCVPFIPSISRYILLL